MLGCGADLWCENKNTKALPWPLLLHPRKLLVLGMWFVLKLDFYDKSTVQHHGSFMLC